MRRTRTGLVYKVHGSRFIDKALLWARQVLSAHAQLYIASLDGGSALKQGLGKSPLQLLLFSMIAHSAFKSKIKFKLQLFLL